MKKGTTELEKAFGSQRLRVNESMSSHTTFKIGGPAEYYLEVEKIDDLVKAIKVAKSLSMPFFIFGIGSNILVSDAGIKGLIIKNNCRQFDILQMSGRIKNRKVDLDRAFVFAESGAITNQVVRFTIDHGLKGLESQLGLPGTIGGAIFMNSNFPKEGSYIGDCLYSAKILTKDGEIKEVDNSYFHFSYDKSLLQKTGEILLSVIFNLESADKKQLWEKASEVLKYRGETQPKKWSAGCVFRNISLIEALRIPTPGRTTSAGYLIDKAGFKGKRIGDAMISDIHANFILNMGNAKAKDVMDLINMVKDDIYKKFGTKLELEIKTIGF